MIAEKPQYAGQCMRCKQTFNKGQVTRHLKKCVAQHQEEAGKPVMMFHVVIEGNHMPMYWLHVEIPGALTLQHLDAFLRDIWLECCGHLSCFTIDGQRYSVHPAEDVLFGPREQAIALVGAPRNRLAFRANTGAYGVQRGVSGWFLG